MTSAPTIKRRRCYVCRGTFLAAHPKAKRCDACVPRCMICGEALARRGGSMRCLGCYGITRRVTGAKVDAHTRYDDDLEAQRFVAQHPDGATLEEIGEAMGLVRERIRQIEERALRTFALRMRIAGVDEDDVLRMLSRSGATWDVWGENEAAAGGGAW